jgi:ribonuclease HI
MKIYASDFINPGVINIFSDASMWPQANNSMIGCYGFISMQEKRELNSGVYLDSNTTVNKCEIKGVKYSVFEAIRLRQQGFNGIINIFCDSQVSILGIREWIFKWTVDNSVLMNNSGNEVANQSEFIQIMQLIIKYNPNINFYHQKGHVELHDNKKLSRAIRVFISSNFPNSRYEDIDANFIKYISMCNNEIDNRTRWFLRNQSDAQNRIYSDPFKFVPTNNYENELHYYNLITGGRYNV